VEIEAAAVYRSVAMIWQQRWNDVLFLHFPVPSHELDSLVPPQVEVDTFGGEAWLSYVFFRLQLRPAWLPWIPGLSSLIELNLRTYVRHRGQPGIVFLSMHANNRLAIRAASWLTPLVYRPARMAYESSADGWRRAVCRAKSGQGGELSVTFRPVGHLAEAQPGLLDAWLVERYRLYVLGPKGKLLAADVEHPPWQISPAEIAVNEHTLGDVLGLPLRSSSAAAHYSPGVVARFHAFHTVAAALRVRSFVSPPARAIAPHGGR
jgi:uncharacterized protein YqjF (DUF2071 family)